MESAKLRLGEKYGVYVVRFVCHSYKTLECSICGGMTRHENEWFLMRDMSRCICDEIYAIKKERLKACWLDIMFPTQSHINYAVRMRSERLGIPVVYPTAKEVFDVVGIPPQSTEDVKFSLAIKKDLPPIPENFFWRPDFQKDFVQRQQEAHGGQCRSQIMRKIKKAYSETGTTMLENCSTLKRIHAASCKDYASLIGKTRKNTTVTDIVHFRRKTGKFEYFCVMRCHRCGKDFTKPAWAIKNTPLRQFCPFCAVGSRFKNSAYFDRQEDSITPDKLLCLAETTSWYTVNSASPDFILANAELALRGKENVCL